MADSSDGTPFACTFSSSFAQFLYQHGCTLAITTYHTNRLILISASSSESIIQLPRVFPRAMAAHASGDRLAIACRDTVEVLAACPSLAPSYPSAPGTYDTVYAPRATYRSGCLDIHGLAWGTEGLWAVNTHFSCLSLIDDSASFTPKWRPPFVGSTEPGDRCHLNGLAMKSGAPVYVTSLGTGDEAESWRRELPSGGALVRVPDGEIVATELSMPHSPRLWDDTLWLLLSATGEIIQVDQKSGVISVVTRLNAFVRGLDRFGSYLVVGMSRLRESSFGNLPVAGRSGAAGVAIVSAESAEVVAELRYQSTVEEIYDVVVLPAKCRPGIMGPDSMEARKALVTPYGSYWAQ